MPGTLQSVVLFREAILRKCACAIALLALCTASAFGEAAQPVEVGIPSARFNFVAASQLETEWCWAASVQMVLNWYGVPVQQTQVVKRIYGKTVDSAASEDEIAVALNGTAINRQGQKVYLHAKRKTGAPPTALLIREMSAEHPMLITVHSTKSMLHAVVITSVEFVQTPGSVEISAITFRDPNPTFHDRRGAVAYRVTGAKLERFLHSISSYYLVNVTA